MTMLLEVLSFVLRGVQDIFEAGVTDLVQGAGALKHERMPKNERVLRFCC